ncbi:MAG: IS91 family transposase [Bacteroidota bacterium]
MQPVYEIATILNRHWDNANVQLKLNSWQWRTLHAIRRCRTAALGGHVDQCDHCSHLHISYNSCRNRHCPKCQGQQREAWMEARKEDILPVPYFHVVFTVPDAINKICLYQPATIYNILFNTAWSTMQTFAADEKYLGAQTGMISILHTWGKTLSLHPHLHCVIPGGGITKAGHWKNTRNDGHFLFPVKALSLVFRARFVSALRKAFPDLSKEFYNNLFKTNWVVYAKRPFGGPLQVIEYLSRYTHKIAISNHRITNIGIDTVSFGYKDYRQAGNKKEMTLDALEFIRRFAMHVLPKGFVRIRHYGILSSKLKQTALATIRTQLQPGLNQVNDGGPTPTQTVTTHTCPCCKKGLMQTILHFDYRGPPLFILKQLERMENTKTLKSAV